MDISVKLNQVYPSVVPASPVVDKEAKTPAKVQEAAAPDGQPHTREDLEKAVGDIREFVQSSQRQLDFSIDDSTGQVVVKVIATDSGEVIRQLPSETALKLAQSLSEAGSLLFEGRA
ncbi:UNVERIFIED_ORG: flagellar protein FlaG [Pseudomonas parafulva]|jgi:flagellar protein FlaG|uniref:flagellar protein FlaG n=1 Tax=Pseudomonas TaxID=286 RepID=UPI00048E6CD4|nr:MULTISPECIES: flagellar protein FlaG [Pseudomonas]MDP9556395.1 flagellar protein FlaG [Pseudomonas parafulva]MBA1220517.1 flagellar protein FlaG [Pseudomonas fulva]MBF8775894.1 flagellar protein FlaG [Pseudomonas fulva]MBN4165689.1 flagellar protein FlaG [Pseudomonas fulva]MCP3788717.1 flagellar protein FlaG [Pseudomonas sp. N2-11]